MRVMKKKKGSATVCFTHRQAYTQTRCPACVTDLESDLDNCQFMDMREHRKQLAIEAAGGVYVPVTFGDIRRAAEQRKRAV